MEALDRLLPRPRKVVRGEGRLLTPTSEGKPEAATVLTDDVPHREGYVLEIDAAGVRLAARSATGLAHGRRTLAQLASPAADARIELPYVRIEDEPALTVRGAMLDVSRDRVPTMETLFHIVELLASWKLNQLQLYTEHTFAYAGHEQVWRGWDPLTPDEVRALDAFCAERGIELVPNQQSFGHMHHWLVHERYRDLAECPDGVEHPFLTPGSPAREPFSLNPLDPRCFELLEELYDQLLPCFSSRELNVGLDETFDLGTGRSRAACAERGEGRVYVEFLTRVAELVRARGRRMHFWADVLLHHPELITELPGDVVPNLWGYEADHPFEEECARVAASGLDFVVCPGTSSWQSLGGRLANMRTNVERAVQCAHGHGARGILITDWGDRGHLQPLPVSYPGWAHAADRAWNPDGDARTEDELEAALAAHVPDVEAATAHALFELGRVGEATGVPTRNASPLSLVLTKATAAFPPPELAGLDVPALDRARDVLARAAGALTPAGTSLVHDELAWVHDVLAFACDLAQARSSSPSANHPPKKGASLASGLERLLERHGELWLARSRPAGLERSQAWLAGVRGALG